MFKRTGSAQLLQKTALLLALICLWISGPVAMHHTDEVVFFAAAGQNHSRIGHVTPPATQTPCAACEWEQSFSHPNIPSVHIAYLPLIQVRYTAALPVVLHVRRFDYTALRGPPSLLS